MYVPLGIAILCSKTVYYMGVRVMRWDNFTVVYGACTEYFFMGTCGFYKALGPSALRLHTEATRAHIKVLRILQ